MGEANPHRGEVSLDLGARALTLRPSFAALVAIERETGLGLMQLAYRIGCGSVEHLPAVIQEAARAAGDAVERAEIEASIDEAGVVPVLRAASRLLGNAMTGGVEEKNADAAEATRSEAPSPSAAGSDSP